MNIKIGDIFKIGVGNINMKTGKNNDIVDAEVTKVNEKDCELVMIDFGGPIQIVSKVYLTEKRRVKS